MVWSCIFLPQNNETYLDLDQGDLFCTTNAEENSEESPIYAVFKKYVPPTILSGMRICLGSLFIIIHPNIIEGLMYLHIFIYAKR